LGIFVSKAGRRRLHLKRTY